MESSAAFSLAGVQTSTATGDGKTLTGSVSNQGSGPQSGQLDQKSTGVAAQGENAASSTPLIHSGKLVERIGEAELRLGIRAGEFGSVDIRTSMVRNQFTAEISTDRGELGRAMAAELPSLQDRLSEHRVPVGNISLQNNPGGHSAGAEQHRPQNWQQPMYPTTAVSERAEGQTPAVVGLEAVSAASRLDIHM